MKCCEITSTQIAVNLMPATRRSIIDSALHEWEHWGQSTWNLILAKKNIGHKDDDPAFAQYVIDNYCSIAGGSPSQWAIQDDEYPWSAVGMSAFMFNGGLTRSQFPFAQSHSSYIRKFITARKTKKASLAYWGYRIDEKDSAPDVGDLVAYIRGKDVTPEKALSYYDRLTAYESHTDLVVDKRAGEIDVLGANVMDSVTIKTLKITSTGHINDPSHLWFAVLKSTL
jgi:hypothetical protein